MSRLGLNGSDTSLPPSAWTLTVLHLVSDAIRNDPNGDIPNSAAKLQRIFGLCKKKTKLFKINKIFSYGVPKELCSNGESRGLGRPLI